MCVNESLPLAVVYPIGISKGLRVAKPAFLQPTSNTPTDATWSGILEGLMLLSPKREDASRINKYCMLKIKDEAMTNLAAALETALQNEVNKMNTQERVSITVTVKMEKEKEPIDKTDWLSMARTYLPQRVSLKDYRSMSVELYAMEDVGLHWQRDSPSVNLLACTLGNILNGYVSVRTLRNRMSDLDPQGKHEEKVEKALAFWKTMTQK